MMIGQKLQQTNECSSSGWMVAQCQLLKAYTGEKVATRALVHTTSIFLLAFSASHGQTTNLVLNPPSDLFSNLLLSLPFFHCISFLLTSGISHPKGFDLLLTLNFSPSWFIFPLGGMISGSSVFSCALKTQGDVFVAGSRWPATLPHKVSMEQRIWASSLYCWPEMCNNGHRELIHHIFEVFTHWRRVINFHVDLYIFQTCFCQ